jgi:hypothetical protein
MSLTELQDVSDRINARGYVLHWIFERLELPPHLDARLIARHIDTGKEVEAIPPRGDAAFRYLKSSICK